jgi:hypothetical protein
MASAPIEVKPKVLSVKETIQKYAELHQVSAEQLLTVAKCESSYDPKALGDNGKAANIFQYHKATFIGFSKLMGEELDYHSYEDQAKLTAWIWKYHPEYRNQWTCFTKFY